MIVCKLDRCTEPSMVFSDHPAAFNEWKNSKEPLRVLSKTGEPIATFMPFDEVFANTIVRNTFRRVNAAKKNEFPWLPFGIMAQHNLAVFHDSSNIFMIEKYRLTPQPTTKTRNTTTKKTREKSMRLEHRGAFGTICNDRGWRKLYFLNTDYTQGTTFSTYGCSPRHISREDVDRHLKEFFRDTVNLTIALGGSMHSHEDVRRSAKALTAIAKESSRNTSRVRDLNEFI